MTSEPDRDAMTVRLLVGGDPEGVRRLLQDHEHVVRDAITKEFRDVLDAQQIDDALSQAGARAWQSSRRFDPRLGTLRVWFYVIARNCARRVLTAKLSSSVSYMGDLDGKSVQLPRPEIPGPGEPVGEPGWMVDLRTCIANLPRLQRAIVEADLAAGGSAPGKDLADSLNTSTNSIYVSRNHARKALRQAMRELGHDLDAAFSDVLDALDGREQNGRRRGKEPKGPAPGVDGK